MKKIKSAYKADVWHGLTAPAVATESATTAVLCSGFAKTKGIIFRESIGTHAVAACTAHYGGSDYDRYNPLKEEPNFSYNQKPTVGSFIIKYLWNSFKYDLNNP